MVPKDIKNRSKTFSPHLQVGSSYCQLTVEGVVAGYFQIATNLGKEYEVIEHKVGDEVIKIKGRLRYKRVTLKRAITADLSMWEWRRMVELGNISAARKDCTITALDQSLTAIASWTLTDAWPLGVVSERDSSGVNFEVITLATESFTRVS